MINNGKNGEENDEGSEENGTEENEEIIEYDSGDDQWAPETLEVTAEWLQVLKNSIFMQESNKTIGSSQILECN